MIRILPRSESNGFLERRSVRLADAVAAVRPILDAVRERGDAALLEYARQFDGLDRATPIVAPAEIERAVQGLAPALREAIEEAATNIRAFAQLQLPKAFESEPAPGRRVGQIVRPLRTVAAYIPAGRYPLVSTVLMTMIPAQVAGVPEICLTTPRPSADIFGAAGLLGAERVFLLGGAHAIAAFAFGTASVPRADRIVGPGNIYVAAAKKLLAGEVGIEFLAGPTEIVIIANEGEPGPIAADLLAQAEHDLDANAILLTSSRQMAEAVAAEVEHQLATLPTAEVARQAIERNSAIILCDSAEEAMAWSNRFAPEHLSLHDESLLAQVQHAGSVFLGAMTPEAAGDYASGPNHVLPTSGVARLRGGLSAADFVKVISTQQLDAAALQKLAPTVTTLARAEGLEAHARSVEIRRSTGVPPVRPTGVSPAPIGRAPTPRAAVQKMAAYAPPTGGREGKLRLDFNENTLGASPRVAEALRAAISAGQLAVYPEYTRATTELARHFGVAEEQLLFTNGTDEAIQVLLQTFVEPADEVISLEPSYAMYRFYAELGGARVRTVRYKAKTLAFPREELLAAASSATRAILLSNPNNPTGTAATREEIEEVLRAVPQSVVLVDEAYFEFCGVTMLDLVGRYPNLFVSRTFSKAYGMAGLRFGCLFSDARHLAGMRKAQSPYSVNALATIAARAAVADDEYVRGYVAEVLAAREFLYAELKRGGIPFFRSEGNFVLLQLGDDVQEICRRLREAGVLIRDRSHEIPGCARVTVGTREQVTRFLKELRR